MLNASIVNRRLSRLTWRTPDTVSPGSRSRSEFHHPLFTTYHIYSNIDAEADHSFVLLFLALCAASFRYLAEKYKLDMSSASNVNHLSKAIARGAETKAFELPKGSGGRIKLAKVVSSYNSNELHLPQPPC